ncbi:MAG: hypothetical protein SPI85_03260, partial [Ellagibacter isourolithinifaciens]|nr:hypothetical protein [Ellagibacter isourolithinifaciens]
MHGAQARRAGDARCGGALARIRVWGLGAARLLYELILCGFAWSKIPSSLWHFVPEWSSFSANGFVVLFMNNYEYKSEVLKQLNGEYNMNNIHIFGQNDIVTTRIQGIKEKKEGPSMTEAMKTLAQLKKASKLTRLAFHKNGPKSFKRGQGALLKFL